MPNVLIFGVGWGIGDIVEGGCVLCKVKFTSYFHEDKLLKFVYLRFVNQAEGIKEIHIPHHMYLCTMYMYKNVEVVCTFHFIK